MLGRLRTPSKPSRTWMSFDSYFGALFSISDHFTAPRLFLPGPPQCRSETRVCFRWSLIRPISSSRHIRTSCAQAEEVGSRPTAPARKLTKRRLDRRGAGAVTSHACFTCASWTPGFNRLGNARPRISASASQFLGFAPLGHTAAAPPLRVIFPRRRGGSKKRLR